MKKIKIAIWHTYQNTRVLWKSKGVSQGHSNAIRRIESVKDARQWNWEKNYCKDRILKE